MVNATELKFGYPDNCIAQTAHWTVLLRPRQPTLGSLVLVCRDEARAFSAISPEAFAGMGQVVKGIETMLREVTGYERINYLMLMMVDPDVHMHVIPRYGSPREFAGVAFPDTGWPGPPALEPSVTLAPSARDALLQRLVGAWPGRS